MPRGFDSDDLNAGLVLCVPFDEYTGFPVDIGPYHHKFTSSATGAWGAETTGKTWMYFLQASHQYLATSAAASNLDFTSGDFSGAGWCMPVGAKDGYAGGNGGWNNGGWFWRFQGNNFFVYTAQSGTQQSSGATSVLTRNVWQSFGWSRSGSSVRVYVNGRDVTSIVDSHSNPTITGRVFTINCNPVDAAWAQARYSMLRIWGRKLLPHEHMLIFNRERDLFGV